MQNESNESQQQMMIYDFSTESIWIKQRQGNVRQF